MDAGEREMRELAEAVRRDLLYREPRDVARERGWDIPPGRPWLVLLPWHAACNGGPIRYYNTVDPWEAAYMHSRDARPAHVDVWRVAVDAGGMRAVNHRTITVT
jgi:hypothetical protein